MIGVTTELAPDRPSIEVQKNGDILVVGGLLIMTRFCEPRISTVPVMTCCIRAMFVPQNYLFNGHAQACKCICFLLLSYTIFSSDFYLSSFDFASSEVFPEPILRRPWFVFCSGYKSICQRPLRNRQVSLRPPLWSSMNSKPERHGSLFPVEEYRASSRPRACTRGQTMQLRWGVRIKVAHVNDTNLSAHAMKAWRLFLLCAF